MICPRCHHYRPLGQPQTIAPVCAWHPSPEQVDQLRAILPAPALTAALVMSAPYQVEMCGAFVEIGQ